MVALSLLTKEIYRIRRQLKKKAVNILPGELGSDDAVEATMAAVTAMETAGMTKEDPEASVYDNILVLSVRTGMAKLERKYTAADVNGGASSAGSTRTATTRSSTSSRRPAPTSSTWTPRCSAGCSAARRTTCASRLTR